MFLLFDKNIENIISNYIPHERITSNDRDPPWLTTKLRSWFKRQTLHTGAMTYLEIFWGHSFQQETLGQEPKRI